MFLPILNYADGYGFTYGGRVSTMGLLGAGERLSVPLTWGGTRRAALEVDRTFKRGADHAHRIERRHLAAREPALRARRSAGRVNGPRRAPVARGVPDRRARPRRAPSTSATTDDRLWTLGADAALDTRARSRPSRATPSYARRRAGPACTCEARRTGSISTRPMRAATSGVIGQAVLARACPVHRGDRRAADLRAAAARRRLDAARIWRRHVRRRSPAGDVRRAARADHVGPEQRAPGRDRRSSTPARRGTRPNALPTATWHSGIGGGVFLIAPLVQAQSRRRPRSERRRHAGAPRGRGSRSDGTRQLTPSAALLRFFDARTRRWPDARPAGACTRETRTRHS